MPEIDTLHGIEHCIKRVQQAWQRSYRVPFLAQPILFPRCFTLGTETKPYTTCTVEDSAMFVDPKTLPALNNLEVLQPADLVRAEGQPFRPLLGLLEGGELFVKARGKELLIAAGLYALRFHLGLEGITAVVNTADFWELVSRDCSGANQDGEKSNIMRSFIVPPQLTTPQARELKHDQTINVFAAFVGAEQTFLLTDHSRLLRIHVMVLSRPFTDSDLQPGSQLWPDLWSANHGPDWIFERADAELVLDAWRDSVIGSSATTRGGMEAFLRQSNSDAAIHRMQANASRRSKAVHVVARRPAPCSETIMHVLTEKQEIFNGYGQHTASDLLHTLRIWPGMPVDELCKNRALFQSFKQCLHTYAAQFVTPLYRERCLSVASGAAFAFNYKSDTNYINQYLLVYRKCSVRITCDVYNAMAKEGLFNEQHTIGDLYRYSDDELITVKHRDVDVFMYKDLEKKNGAVWYSAIRAKPPLHWRALPGPHVVVKGALHAGMSTTIGPASFYLFKQNQYEVTIQAGKPGRKQKIMGKGRPSYKPRISVLRQRDNRSRKKLDRQLEMLKKDPSSEPPHKRRKIISRSVPPPPSDRVTRSRKVA